MNERVPLDSEHRQMRPRIQLKERLGTLNPVRSQAQFLQT